MEWLRLLPKSFGKGVEGSNFGGLQQLSSAFFTPPFRPEPSWYKYSHTPAIVSDKRVRKGNVHTCIRTHKHTHTHTVQNQQKCGHCRCSIVSNQRRYKDRVAKDMYRAFIKAKCAPRGVLTIVNCTVCFLRDAAKDVPEPTVATPRGRTLRST